MKNWFLCVLVLLSIQLLHAEKTITINIHNANGNITVNLGKSSYKIECANCGRDLTDEDMEIISCAAYGPYALYMCTECAKEFEKNCHLETDELLA